MSDAAHWPVVWITGASSGIGRALALALAGEGSLVAASARSVKDLHAVCEEAAALPGKIIAFPLDVTDEEAADRVFAHIERECGPVDLALFCAGTYAQDTMGQVSPALFAMQLHVNVMGVVNCLAPVLPHFTARRGGHVAIVASVSGYRGLPRAAAYGASKAALINLAEALNAELRTSGVSISVVNPGFVRTPLTDQNDFPMPFLVSAEAAAARIVTGLKRKRFEIAFPWRLVLPLKLMRILPYSLYFRLLSRITGI